MRKPAPASAPTVWPLYVVTFLSTYTVGVASVSAPGIQVALGIAEARTSLVVGAYSATVAAGLIIFGRLGDRWGRRRLFLLGTAGLAVTALLTAAAPSLTLLVAARLLQGCAAAMVAPQVLATIQAVLTGAARLRAVSMYAVVAGSGTIGGQIIGGAINTLFGQELGWRAAFGSVAVGAVCAWLGSRHLTETRSPAPLSLDMRGSTILAISLFLLIAGLTNAASVDIASPLDPLAPTLSTAILLGTAVVGLCLLLLHARSRDRAGITSILPLRVIAVPGVRIGVALAVLLFMMIGGFMYNFAILSQLGFGYTPFESGIATALLAAAFVVSSTIAPRLVTRWGGPTRGGPQLLVLAAFIQSSGLLFLGIVAVAHLDPFILWYQFATIAIGGGQGLMMGPLIAVIMSAIPDEVAGLTGGLVATGQQMGIGLGIAVLSTAFTGLGQLMPMQSAYGWTTGGTLILSLAFGLLAWRLRAHSRRADAGG